MKPPACHLLNIEKAALTPRLLFCLNSRLSARGFAARRQRFGRWAVSRGNGKQLRRINIQSGSEPFNQIERGVEIASLEPADRGAINLGINRKIFLRDFACGPCRPEIPCNTFAKPHDGMKHHLVVALSIGYIRHNSSFTRPAQLHNARAGYFKLPANRRG